MKLQDHVAVQLAAFDLVPQQHAATKMVVDAMVWDGCADHSAFIALITRRVPPWRADTHLQILVGLKLLSIPHLELLLIVPG
jgi:hypothetical protein